MTRTSYIRILNSVLYSAETNVRKCADRIRYLQIQTGLKDKRHRVYFIQQETKSTSTVLIYKEWTESAEFLNHCK